MNNKMAINSQLSTTESKITGYTNKQNRNRIIDHLGVYQLGEGRERMREKVQGLRSTNW